MDFAERNSLDILQGLILITSSGCMGDNVSYCKSPTVLLKMAVDNIVSNDVALLNKSEIKEIGNWQKYPKGIGMKLMEKMGWEKGKGIGKEMQGRAVPVEAVVRKGKVSRNMKIFRVSCKSLAEKCSNKLIF